LLEVGSVSTKNTSNILIKNLFDTFIGALAYWLVGFSFANEAKGGLIGTANFLTNDFTHKQYLKWIFQYSFCTTSATIVSGSLAERTFVDTYIIFSFLMSSFVFPIVSAWVWGGGWLSELGFHDYAGSGVVHMLGGLGGFVGTIILGPRLGVFEIDVKNDDENEDDKKKDKNNKVLDPKMVMTQRSNFEVTKSFV